MGPLEIEASIMICTGISLKKVQVGLDSRKDSLQTLFITSIKIKYWDLLKASNVHCKEPAKQRNQ